MRVFFLLTISILFIEQLKCDELVEMSDGSGEEPDSKIVEMLSGDDASNKTKCKFNYRYNLILKDPSLF